MINTSLLLTDGVIITLVFTTRKFVRPEEDSVKEREGGTLVSTTSFLLIMSAILLISANWFIGLAWLAATLIEVVSRVRFEEAIMREQFGAQYRDYMEETGTLIPRIF